MRSRLLRKDLHFPTWLLDNPLRRLFSSPGKYAKHVRYGQVAADLGCGPGFYTLKMAEAVGDEGRVYAVDSDGKSIQSVKRKAVRRKLENVDARTSSSSQIGFIPDESVDFVLAAGLLCWVAPEEHTGAVGEIKRILKPQGKAYIETAASSVTYVNDDEWEQILDNFEVEERNQRPYKGNRWAYVRKK